MAGRFVTIDEVPRGARAIVCGGRMYGRLPAEYESESAREDPTARLHRVRVAYEKRRLYEVLDELSPREIAEGGALGADRLAREWAIERGVPYKTYAALWTEEGRAAGPKRNRRMASGFLERELPDNGVIAFPGGAGTRDMENVGLDFGVWVLRVK